MCRIESHRADYEQLPDKLGSPGVPWYAIAFIHSLESDLDFHPHLHNGDPLKGRTVHEPRNMPVNPPADSVRYTWHESAFDALKHDGALRNRDWTVEESSTSLSDSTGLDIAEGILSPYLWSFSNHCEEGKSSATASSPDKGLEAVRCRGIAIALDGSLKISLADKPGASLPDDESPPSPAPYPSVPADAAAVAKVQTLTALGGFLKDIIDGDFGPLTGAAVRHLSKDGGIR